jgi:hypothetical protein
MQPGFSNMQPTPGWKGNPPGQGDLLPGETKPLGRRPSAFRRLLSRFGGGTAKPKD